MHRDLKPSNVLHDPRTGDVKIADWGLAREVPRQLRRGWEEEGEARREASPAAIHDANSEEQRAEPSGTATARPAAAPRAPTHISANMTGSTGTDAYMSPEVARGDPYGFPADVFSFGILAASLVLGTELPYGYFSGAHIAAAVRDRPDFRPALPGGVDAELAGLLRACWSAEPRDRPRFGEVCERLEGVAARAKRSGWAAWFG